MGSLFMAYMVYHIIPVKCPMGVAFTKLGGGGGIQPLPKS